MSLELVSTTDPAVMEAVRAAAAEAGVELGPSSARLRASWGEPRWHAATRDAWWSAGVAEAVEPYPAAPAAGSPYEVAPSPRSTRGATRA